MPEAPLVPGAEVHALAIEPRPRGVGLGTYKSRFDHLAESWCGVAAGA